MGRSKYGGEDKTTSFRKRWSSGKGQEGTAMDMLNNFKAMDKEGAKNFMRKNMEAVKKAFANMSADEKKEAISAWKSKMGGGSKGSQKGGKSKESYSKGNKSNWGSHSKKDWKKKWENMSDEKKAAMKAKW